MAMVLLVSYMVSSGVFEWNGVIDGKIVAFSVLLFPRSIVSSTLMRMSLKK